MSSLSLPIAVFLDTNVLDELPLSLQSGELSALVSQAERVLVTDITAREWIAHRIQKAEGSLDDAAKAQRHLRHFGPTWVITQPPEIEERERIVQRHAIQDLRNAGLRIVAPPRIDQRDIMRRAVMKIPPFADRGRGFKDELVLLGILRFLSKWQYASVILVTKDRDFSDISPDRFAQRGTRFLTVKTIAEAKSQIEHGLSAAVKIAIAADNERVRKLAESNWTKIEATIKEAARSRGISHFMLLNYGNDNSLGDSLIRRVLSVTPVRIGHVTVGRQHPTSNRTLITISVECDIALELEQINWLGSVLGRKIVVGEEVKDVLPDGEQKTVVVKRSIPVQATARFDDGNWSDLQIIDADQFFRLLTESLAAAEVSQLQP